MYENVHEPLREDSRLESYQNTDGSIPINVADLIENATRAGRGFDAPLDVDTPLSEIPEITISRTVIGDYSEQDVVDLVLESLSRKFAVDVGDISCLTRYCEDDDGDALGISFTSIGGLTFHPNLMKRSLADVVAEVVAVLLDRTDPAIDTLDQVLPSDGSAKVTVSEETSSGVIDISNEASRTYVFAPKVSGEDYEEFEVDGPLYFSTGADGLHQITCVDRVGVAVSSDFLAYIVYPRFGKSAFVNHPIPSNFKTT